MQDAMVINPHTVEQVAAQLLDADLADIQRRYVGDVYPLTERLIQVWHDYAQPAAGSLQHPLASNCEEPLRGMLDVSKALLSMLKPKARQRLRQSLPQNI